jgi:hypothetical protein
MIVVKREENNDGEMKKNIKIVWYVTGILIFYGIL